jgi:hypothetical protein
MMKALTACCLGLSTVLCAQQKSTSPLTAPLEAQARTHHPGEFENQYLTIQILPGWTVATSADQTLNLIQGKYLLSINPIFTHASGIKGGRFSEIVHGPSIHAVMSNVDQPAPEDACSQSEAMTVTKTAPPGLQEAISLSNLYTDRLAVTAPKPCKNDLSDEHQIGRGFRGYPAPR